MKTASTISAATPAQPRQHGEGRTVEIIPLCGIPIVTAVLALLLVAMIGNWGWALMFFHVAGGGLWTGVDLFTGLMIGPVLSRLPIEARVEFSKRFMPKMMLIMPTLVTVTLASGWQVARRYGFLAWPYPMHWWLTASFIVVGVMAVIALGILEPANLAVLFELNKPRPNGELIGKLMRRFLYTAGITGVMQLATLIIMTRLGTP